MPQVVDYRLFFEASDSAADFVDAAGCRLAIEPHRLRRHATRLLFHRGPGAAAHWRKGRHHLLS
jgi:hypothetical protein